jgi:predicted GNAT superfamily acetyltransferase
MSVDASADYARTAAMAGVVPGLATGGVGTAMKLHQRAWCLDRAMTAMTGTFDPLVARNAAFNVRQLGAAFDAPLPSTPRDPEQAPPILDVGEDLSPVVGAAPAAASTVSRAVPADVEELRRDFPRLAAQWRLALRDAMLERWGAGRRPTAVGRDGRYLMEAL